MSSDKTAGLPLASTNYLTCSRIFEHLLLAVELNVVLHNLQVLAFDREARFEVVHEILLLDAIDEQGHSSVLGRHQRWVAAEKGLFFQRLLSPFVHCAQKIADSLLIGHLVLAELMDQKINWFLSHTIDEGLE